MKKVSPQLKHVFAALLIMVFAFSTIILYPQVTDAFTVNYSSPLKVDLSSGDKNTSTGSPAYNYSPPSKVIDPIPSSNTDSGTSVTAPSSSPAAPGASTDRPITVTVNGSSYTYYSKTTGSSAAGNTGNVTTPEPTPAPTPPASKEPVEVEKDQPKVEKKVLASGTKYATDLYIYRSGKPGPTVMIVGGVHGNEPAGYKAAGNAKDYSVKKGTLIVLPQANKRAVAINKRYVSGEGDLNRDFPRTKSESPDNTLSKAIYNAVKTYDVDWLMDMHEGYDYYKNKSTSSVGQSLIYYPANSTKTIASKIVSNLNKGISTSSKKFSLLRYPVKGSLARSTGEFLDVNSFIFETCTKQKLSTRIDYQLKAANTLLAQLGMK
jgi:hypothetical protein